MKSYTVKELAQKFSVTEMAIHKQLKHDKIKDFVIYENNRKFLSEEGLVALETLRNDNQKYSSKAKELPNDTLTAKAQEDGTYGYFDPNAGGESILYRQLVKQLEIKDSQINDLASLLGKQTDQVNLLTHTVKHMNGTLQLKEVANITSDINDLADEEDSDNHSKEIDHTINIKDIESDIISRFNNTYQSTNYTPVNTVEEVSVSEVEIEVQQPEPIIQEVAQPIIQETPISPFVSSFAESVNQIEAIGQDIKQEIEKIEQPVQPVIAQIDNSDEIEGVIFSEPIKKEEPEEIEQKEERKKGFFGKLFSK